MFASGQFCVFCFVRIESYFHWPCGSSSLCKLNVVHEEKSLVSVLSKAVKSYVFNIMGGRL